jgi:hypothetical protein
MAKKKTAASPSDPAAPQSSTPARRRTTVPRTAAAASNGSGGPDPTHDEIAEAAYHRYLSRQGAPGSDFDDWLEAERELRSRS